MTAPTYELWYTTDTGTRLIPLDRALWWQASRQVNRIGSFAMGLPSNLLGVHDLKPDNMIQIWRAPTGGRLKLWRVYFLRGWRFAHQGSREVLTLWGPDTNDLLRRRICARYADDVGYLSDNADDLMKDIVADAITDGTTPAPDYAGRDDWDLSVQGDLGDGPVMAWECAWKPLMTASGGGLLPEIANIAREQGTEVFFDIVPDATSSTSISFEFRTYTGQPGMDVSDSVVFSQEDRNLRDPFIEYDYSDEVNYVYAGGKGQRADRAIYQFYDEDRILASAWNRCEAFKDAGDQIKDGLLDAGRSALEEGRPIIRAGGIPVDTAGTRFGLHWDHGSKVKMKYRREEFDCIVRSTVLSVRDGQETVDARLEYES